MDTNDQLFYSIYTRYMPILRVAAKRNGVPYDDIEDVIQDTFISYYQNYPLTWEDYIMKAMLCRILKNRCIDLKRRRDTHPVTYWDPEEMQVDIEVLNKMKGKDTLELYIEREEYRAVWDALNSMRKDWAQVFILYIIQDRPMEEVSKLLETTDAACRTRLTRGRKYLKEKTRRNLQD